MTMIVNDDDDGEGSVFDLAAARESWSSRPTLEQRLAAMGLVEIPNAAVPWCRPSRSSACARRSVD
jgi:hypothetical protein